MKKLIVCLLALAMVLGLCACAEPEPVPTEATEPPTMAPYEPSPKMIHLLVPENAEDWEAAAVQAAQAKADELNAAGTAVTVSTYADAQAQIKLLEDIATQSPQDGSVGVVLMPASEEVADALQKLLDANVSYALADNIPAAAAGASVANVHYDHYQIGAAAAAYLVNAGLTQKNDIVILQGFSDQDAQKTEGFKLYLEGKREVDGKTIETPWTDFSTISYSDMETADREGAKGYFETYMEDADQSYTGYFAAWDDQYILGMLDALEDEHISKTNRNHLFSMDPTLTGFGTDAELMQLLTPEEPEETEQTDDDTDTPKDADDPKYTYLEDFSDINSMCYDANMLQMALQAMADYMAGNVVEQEQLQSVQWYFQPEVEASGEDTPEETE